MKATTLATRSESKVKIPDDSGRMEAANLREPVSRKVLRTRARGAKRKLEARIGAIPTGKVVEKRPIKKSWIDGKVREHREEWKREVKAHCEMCHDDGEKLPRCQRREYKNRGGKEWLGKTLKAGCSLVAVDVVLRPGEDDEERGQRAWTCLVTEMLRDLCHANCL